MMISLKPLMRSLRFFNFYGSPIIHDNMDESILLVDQGSNASDDEIKAMEYWIVIKEIFNAVFYSGVIVCPFFDSMQSK